MLALSLFAHLLADDRDDPLMRSEVVWGVLAMTAAFLVGAGVIYAADKWRKRAAAGPTDADTAKELTSFREMYESGEITEAEYAELRRRVAGRVKKPPPAPTPPPVAPLDLAQLDLAQTEGPAAPTAPANPVPPPPPTSPPAGPPESPPPPSTA
jgi:hypothetical protein